MSTTRRSKRSWIFAIASVATAIAVGYAIYESVWALRASHTLVMGRFATSLIEDFVRQHDGRWPSSWEELDVFDDQNGDRHLSDLRSMRRAVSVNFDADPAILARQSSTEFTAIQPRAPCSPEYQKYWRIDSLIQTLRECQDVNAKPEKRERP